MPGARFSGNEMIGKTIGLALLAASLAATPAAATSYEMWLGGYVTSQTGSFEGYGSIVGQYVVQYVRIETDGALEHITTATSETFRVTDQGYSQPSMSPVFFSRDGLGNGVALSTFATSAEVTLGTGYVEGFTDWLVLNQDGSPYRRTQFNFSALVAGLDGRAGHIRVQEAFPTDTLSTFTNTVFARPEQSYAITFAPRQFDLIDRAIGYSTPSLFPPEPDPNAVPEPCTWALLILGFGSVGAMARRRRQPLSHG